MVATRSRIHAETSTNISDLFDILQTAIHCPPTTSSNLSSPSEDLLTMPSFTRRAPSTNQIPPGARPSPSTPTQYLLPTGIPSLDDLLAGGLPLGQTALIFAPDIHSSWARLVERYWIAQGLLLGQKSLVVGEGGKELVGGCMWVVEERNGEVGGGSESEGEGVGEGDGQVGRTRIAWRYEKMKKFQTTIGSQSGMSRCSLD